MNARIVRNLISAVFLSVSAAAAQKAPVPAVPAATPAADRAPSAKSPVAKAPVANKAPAVKAPLAVPAPDAAPYVFTLKNGLRTTFTHTGTERKATVALVLESGEIDEPSFGAGLASLTADILLQGTVARSAKTIETETASLGTKLSVRAGPISTTLSGDVDDARIPHFLSLVADIVRHPLLDTAGFNRVRRNALRALDSALHNESDLAKQQWRAIIFPDGPFGRPYAVATTLSQLLLGHVRNVYDDNYAARRTHLYISGVFDDAAVESAVREIFSDWKAGDPSKPLSIHAATVHELATIDQPGAARSVTWIGLPVIDPADVEFAKLEVADMLLAGDDSSRVSFDIAGIDSVRPHATSTLWQRRSATYWVDAIDVKAQNAGAALGALVNEILTLQKTAPLEAELDRAKARVIAAFEARNNSREGRASLMQFMDEHSLGDGWRTGYVKRIQAVTREDVRTAVATYLDPQKMAIVVVGDRAVIDPQLVKLRPLIP
jgi:predicted Zn-dependent peptidase